MKVFELPWYFIRQSRTEIQFNLNIYIQQNQCFTILHALYNTRQNLLSDFYAVNYRYFL